MLLIRFDNIAERAGDDEARNDTAARAPTIRIYQWKFNYNGNWRGPPGTKSWYRGARPAPNPGPEGPARHQILARGGPPGTKSGFVAWEGSNITPVVFFVAWESANTTPVVFFVAWKGSNTTPVVFFVTPWGGGRSRTLWLAGGGDPPKD